MNRTASLDIDISALEEYGGTGHGVEELVILSTHRLKALAGQLKRMHLTRGLSVGGGSVGGTYLLIILMLVLFIHLLGRLRGRKHASDKAGFAL
jgi:hypothetical protein